MIEQYNNKYLNGKGRIYHIKIKGG